MSSEADDRHTVTVERVENRRDMRRFLLLPHRIYRNDPLWVPPLLPEVKRKLGPETGVFYRRGDAELFLARRNGRPAGRICLAEDRKTNAARRRKDCVFGFFESAEDYAVAEALFDKAMAWAGRRNLDALFGPFNLDYEDSYGILVEGRDRPPALLCGHNPPYYAGFFDRFGFKPARPHNVAFALELADIDSAVQRLGKLEERARQSGRVRIEAADLDRWDEMVDRVLFLLNEVLATGPDSIPWHRDALEDFLSPFRRIADPELVLFAQVDGRTVGWFPGVPNLNEAFIHANGLRYPWNYASLACRLRRRTECLAVKSVLVLRECWSTGVPILLFFELGRRARRKGYRWMDFSLTQADNPNTIALARRLGARIYKRYQVYRRDLR